jgi:hydrogenase nickel incorporation protein HypA/HybF
MHELYVCQALIGQVETIALEQKAIRVETIYLGIGPLSGVEPRLLEQAFFIARAGTVADDAQLIITSLPIRVSCHKCGHVTDALPARLVCGDCGHWQTQLISGDEMQLERVELVKQTTEDKAEDEITPLTEQGQFG